MSDDNQTPQRTPTGVAYPRILQAIIDEPWAILPSKMAAILEVVDRQVVQGLPPIEAYYDAIAGAQVKGRPVAGGSTYLLPVMGTIAQRMNMTMAWSGGTTTSEIRAELGEAMRDPNVSTILLEVDSPGGSVFDIDELAADIFAARQEKQIIAIANSMMASAAYYLGSQASKIYVTPSGQVGSIGVVMIHVDQSEANAEAGIKPTYIHAPRYKTEGNPDEPLSDEAREFFQARVDEYYGMFVEAVARGRGVSTETVREGFGQGRVLSASGALEAGLVDDVAPLSSVISELNANATRAARRQSAQATLNG